MDLTVKISHSKINSFKECSLKYFYRYNLHIPEPKHPMTALGTCVHNVLECLVNPRHYKKYESIITKRSISKKSVIGKYIIKFLNENNLDKNLFDNAVSLLIAGCEEDFFCEGAEEFIGAEIPFELKNEDPPYYIVGYLDQLARYKDGWYRIKDFKSGKAFSGQSATQSNQQALVYGLAVKKTIDSNAKIACDFIFLKYDGEDRRFRVRINDDRLLGFEQFLGQAYKEIVAFQPKDRWKNPAAKQPYPADKSFSGPTMCGRSKHKGHMVKDGSKEQYHCPVKWAFEFFALVDKDGNQLKTSLDEKDLKIKEEGQKIEKRHWGGCEFFNGGSRF